MTTAAVYLRISSDPSGQALGVACQREDCVALCTAKGWTPAEYVDNDVSASSAKKRPAYERMLADIRDGRIGAVVAWDLDRLHRRPKTHGVERYLGAQFPRVLQDPLRTL